MSRPKSSYRTGSRESYTNFCKEHPHITITFEQFLEILYKYNELLCEHILQTGERIKLPFGLGLISINKFKSARKKRRKDTGEEFIALPINWQESKKQGKKVYHLNLHSDGYEYCWFWMNQESRIRSKEIWKLEFNRVHRRRIPFLLKSSPKYKDLYREYTLRNY